MHGMCNFEDGTRAARRLAKGAPNSSHTSPIAPTATCCSCLLWFFVPVKTEDGKYFPTASLDNEKTRALKGKLFESTLEGLDVENDVLVEVARSW